MNSLGIDLRPGDVILVKGYNDPTGQFRVLGGFGTSPHTSGRAIYGNWLSDGTEDRVEGHEVVKLVQRAG